MLTGRFIGFKGKYASETTRLVEGIIELAVVVD